MRFPTIGGGPFLDGSRAVCIETIRNVVVKGQEGKEKVVVSIERRVGTVEEGESSEDVKRRLWTPNEEDVGESSVIETRDLVFMREKTQEQISHDKEHFEKNHRIVKCAHFRSMSIGNRNADSHSFRLKPLRTPNFAIR